MGLPQEYGMPQNHCRCSCRKVMMHNWNFGVPSFREKHLEGTPRKWQGSTSREDGLVVFQTFLLQVPRLGGPPHWRWTILLALEKILLHRIIIYIYNYIYIYNPRSCDCLILDGEIPVVSSSLFLSPKNFQHIFQPLTSCQFLPCFYRKSPAAQVDCFVNAPRGHADAVKAALMWLGRIKVSRPDGIFWSDHRPRFWNYPLVN